MPNDKITTNLQNAVSEVTTEIETLIEDLELSTANMEDKFSGTERYQNYEDAIQMLENWEEPKVPQALADKEVTYQIRLNPTKKKRRLENIETMLYALHEMLTGLAIEDDQEYEDLVNAIGEMVDEVDGITL